MPCNLGESAVPLSKIVRLSQTYFVDADALNQTASTLYKDAKSFRKQAKRHAEQAQRHEEQATKCEHAALRLQKRGEADRANIQNEFDKLLGIYAYTLDRFLETAENRKTFEDVQARVEEGRAWDHEVSAFKERLSAFEQKYRQDPASSDTGLAQFGRDDMTVQTNAALGQTQSLLSPPQSCPAKQQNDAASDHSEVFFEGQDQTDDPESGLRYEKYSKYVPLSERFRQSSAPSLTSASHPSSTASNRPRSDHLPNFLNTSDPSQLFALGALPAHANGVKPSASPRSMQDSLPSLEPAVAEANAENLTHPAEKNPGRSGKKMNKVTKEATVQSLQSTANEKKHSQDPKGDTEDVGGESIQQQLQPLTFDKNRVSKRKRKRKAAQALAEQQQISASTEDEPTTNLDYVSETPELTADSPRNDTSHPLTYAYRAAPPQRKRQASEQPSQPPPAKKQQPEQVGMAETLLNMAKTLLAAKRQTISAAGANPHAKEQLSKNEDEAFLQARAWVDEQKERLSREEIPLPSNAAGKNKNENGNAQGRLEAQTPTPTEAEAARLTRIEKALQMRLRVLKNRGELAEDAGMEELREYELAEEFAANRGLRW